MAHPRNDKQQTNRVYVVRCSHYEQTEEKIAQLLDAMGGMEAFVQPDERIILKVNLLSAAEPDRAITTHPAVASAVGKRAKAADAKPVIADSPGSGHAYNEQTLRHVYETSGMTDAAEEAGVALNFDTGYETVSYPDGKLTKRFDVIKPVLNADGVINLCKLKTHTYMGMTGAVKNSFGVIPGLSKPGFHAKLSDPNHFANMLLDLSTLVSPRLSITDAVVGMEGDGPGNGSPRRIGLLLASTNPLALDVVGSAIMSLPRQHNPVLLAAEERGLAPNRVDDVELVNADGGCVSIEDLRADDFDLPANAGGVGLESANWWQRSLMPLFKQALTVRPEVVEERCIACGVCRKACPVHAISIGANGRDAARIDDGTCIRCYCCHEMCPQDAITLHKSLLYRLVERF